MSAIAIVARATASGRPASRSSNVRGAGISVPANRSANRGGGSHERCGALKWTSRQKCWSAFSAARRSRRTAWSPTTSHEWPRILTIAPLASMFGSKYSPCQGKTTHSSKPESDGLPRRCHLPTIAVR